MGIFRASEIITCHDNLLASLYDLDVNTICYKEINGECYLVNGVKGKGYEIGLRLKIDKQNLPQDIPLSTLIYDDFSSGMMLSMYAQFLTFTNTEKFITNILLDKYLANEYEFDMSLKEMECVYRKKAMSYRNITLNTKTYNRYVTILHSLSKKEMYLKTSNSFRKDKRKSYGVAGITMQQKFLTINSPYRSGANDITFTYSFGGFGKVIKQSKRYSNIMPRCFYGVSFNQTKLHMVAFYIAKDIFWQRWIINENPRIQSNYYLEVDIDYLASLVEAKTLINKPNKYRNYKNIIRYVERVLIALEAKNEIESYREEFTYDETERFILKHQYDYDIKDDLKNYQFTLDDLDQDVSVKFTIVMPGADYVDFL